jgi:hypothetical protein
MKVPLNLDGSGESRGKQDSKNQGFKGFGKPPKNFFHFEAERMNRPKKFLSNYLAEMLLGKLGRPPRRKN